MKQLLRAVLGFAPLGIGFLQNACMMAHMDTLPPLMLIALGTQIFNDGNKRASVIFANHYLISQGGGMLIIPEKNVPEFKMLLVAYYESNDNEEIVRFMKKQCIKTF